MWVRVSIQRAFKDTSVRYFKELTVTRGPNEAIKNLTESLQDCFTDDWIICVDRVASHEVPEEERS